MGASRKEGASGPQEGKSHYLGFRLSENMWGRERASTYSVGCYDLCILCRCPLRTVALSLRQHAWCPILTVHSDRLIIVKDSEDLTMDLRCQAMKQ